MIDIFHFIAVDRIIYKGCRLGHSQKGCIAFSGIDSETGQLLYITEWMIGYCQLDAKCAANCTRANSNVPCSVHGVNEVIKNIETQMMYLARINHNNLVRYECVQCDKKEDGILVHLAQDFVIGNSLDNLSTLGWNGQSVSMVARGVADALIFLASKRIVHGLLNNTAVYIDNCSTIRVADFALVPYLQDLIGVNPIMKDDLNALGALVESLSPTPSSVMSNFINKCTCQDTIVTNLLDDPFLQSELQDVEDPNDEQQIKKLEVLIPNYTNLEYLDRGGFGVVYKCKNNLDNREYAIKSIPVPKNNSHLTIREAKFHSRLSHRHIVGYNSSWFGTDPLIDEDTESDSMLSDLSMEENDEPPLGYMHIQMEYCDGRTLKHAIENNLSIDVERLWDFFIQIVQGLAYIHQQGIIHRDLKPGNIFITTQDHIKIGDFGMATICYQDENRNQLEIDSRSPEDQEIATKMYRAPELSENRSECTQKVDLYSLGIILFEMSCPPFNTGMERIQVIESIEAIPQNAHEVIKWLLSHNPNDRPSAEELLSSEIIPLSKSESIELNKIIMDNPQSKQYKNIIKRFLQKDCNILVDLTYNHLQFHKLQSSTSEYIKITILKIYQNHGGNEINLPLLTPYSCNSVTNQNTVRLMTNSGTNVYLPPELHLRFARFVTRNRITSMRRYSVEPIYTENILSNIHPKRSYECAFDIITQKPGNLFVAAELLSMAYDITREIPILQQKNISIRINHLNLLKSLFLYFKVPMHKYAELLVNLLHLSQIKITKSKFTQILSEIIPKGSERFYKLSQTKYSLTDVTCPTFLKVLLESENEAAKLVKVALHDLKEMLKLTEVYGVTCKICLVIGLQISYELGESGGIVWQMLAEDKNSIPHQRILAAGHCYDSFLSDYRKFAHTNGWKIHESEVGGVGFSFYLDNLTKEIISIRKLHWTAIDVVVCVQNTQQFVHAVNILKALWDADIHSGSIEAYNVEEARIQANTLGARLIVTPYENDLVKLAVWHKNVLYERILNKNELVEAIQNVLQSSKERNVAFQNTGENQINCILQNEKSHGKSKSTKKRRNGKAFARSKWMEPHLN